MTEGWSGTTVEFLRFFWNNSGLVRSGSWMTLRTLNWSRIILDYFEMTPKWFRMKKSRLISDDWKLTWSGTTLKSFLDSSWITLDFPIKKQIVDRISDCRTRTQKIWIEIGTEHIFRTGIIIKFLSLFRDWGGRRGR